ncbi:MAG: D-aminoacyl-tRNA deacylase, partial [Polyangiaceae bacterium]
MRAVVQRVRGGSVTVDATITGEIGLGLLVY